MELPKLFVMVYTDPVPVVCFVREGVVFCVWGLVCRVSNPIKIEKAAAKVITVTRKDTNSFVVLSSFETLKFSQRISRGAAAIFTLRMLPSR